MEADPRDPNQQQQQADAAAAAHAQQQQQQQQQPLDAAAAAIFAQLQHEMQARLDHQQREDEMHRQQVEGQFVQQLQQMRQELINQFRPAAAANPLEAANAAAGRLPSVKPDTYKGSSSEAANCRIWLAQVDAWLALYPHLDDRMRLRVVICLLRGAALQWWINMRPQPETYGDFSQVFLAYYQPVSAQMTARDKIAALRQTTSVRVYTDAFKEQLTNIPDMDASEAYDRYTRGLKIPIRTQVMLSQVTTLEGAITIAERADTILFSVNGRGNDRGHYRVHRGGNNGPAPMDLGALPARQQPRRTYAAVAAQAPRFPQLTDAERARLRASGGCFYCRGAGHQARECPLKRQQQRRQGNRA